jgi:hypothetical protein
MQFTAKIKTEEVDVKGWQDAVLDYLEAEMRKGGKIFARTALSKIPVRTGFVAGAFGTLTGLLGEEANFNPVVMHIRNTLKAAGSQRITDEYYYSAGGKILKTIMSGQQFATAAADIFRREGMSIVFDYKIDITYFDLNDLEGGHAPTAPWHAFATAEQAFVSFLSNDPLTEMPKIGDYTKVTETTI